MALKKFIPISLSFLSICECLGADPNLDSINSMFNLNEIVITGTRTPKSLKDTPVQTRLIGETEIKRVDATTLQDLLQQEIPGIEFTYAMNQQVNMNVAGFSGLGVLVLVDGERLAGETMDNVDFSRLPMSNVARIEIIRGAASALYGSNAAGGVINIITKKPQKAFSANVNAQAGSHDERRYGASIGFKQGIASNMLEASFNRMGAFDVCLNFDDECEYRNVCAYKVCNIADRLSFNLADNVKLSARGSYYFKERSYNLDCPERYRSYSGGLKAAFKLSENDDFDISYSYDQYDKSDFNKAYALDIRDYSNVQHTVKGILNHSMRNNDLLTIGADFMRDWLLTYQFEDGSNRCQYIADAFAQYDCNVSDAFEIAAAVRWDWFSQNNSNSITPKASLRYRIGDATLHGGYAAGFRAPTLKEKYMQFNMADIFDIRGNSGLKAERSHNLNVSIEYAWRNLYFLASSNYNIIKNKIATSGILYDSEGNPYIQYLNVNDLNVFGVDVTAKGRWRNGLSAALSYNFTHEQKPTDNLSQYCPARPHSLNMRTAWNKEWRNELETDISLSGRFLSSVSYKALLMSSLAESRQVSNPAYMIWKFQIMQDLWHGVKAILAIDNLLNYRPKVYSFNAPVTTGISLQCGLNVDIDKLWKK